jgi:hypothetical protein
LRVRHNDKNADRITAALLGQRNIVVLDANYRRDT